MRTAAKADLQLAKVHNASDVVFAHLMAAPPPSLGSTNHAPTCSSADTVPVPGTQSRGARLTAQPRQEPAGPLLPRGLARQPRSWSGQASAGGRGLLPPVDAEPEEQVLLPRSPPREALQV